MVSARIQVRIQRLSGPDSKIARSCNLPASGRTSRGERTPPGLHQAALDCSRGTNRSTTSTALRPGPFAIGRRGAYAKLTTFRNRNPAARADTRAAPARSAPRSGTSQCPGADFCANGACVVTCATGTNGMRKRDLRRDGDVHQYAERPKQRLQLPDRLRPGRGVQRGRMRGNVRGPDGGRGERFVGRLSETAPRARRRRFEHGRSPADGRISWRLTTAIHS